MFNFMFHQEQPAARVFREWALNSSEDDTRGGLHPGIATAMMRSRSGRLTGFKLPRQPRSRTDRFAPWAFEPAAEHMVAGSVSGFISNH